MTYRHPLPEHEPGEPEPEVWYWPTWLCVLVVLGIGALLGGAAVLLVLLL